MLHILLSLSCVEGNDGVEGPGNSDVSLVDGVVDGDNIGSFTMISFTFKSVEKETYSPINLRKIRWKQIIHYLSDFIFLNRKYI